MSSHIEISNHSPISITCIASISNAIPSYDNSIINILLYYFFNITNSWIFNAALTPNVCAGGGGEGYYSNNFIILWLIKRVREIHKYIIQDNKAKNNSHMGIKSKTYRYKHTNGCIKTSNKQTEKTTIKNYNSIQIRFNIYGTVAKSGEVASLYLHIDMVLNGANTVWCSGSEVIFMEACGESCLLQGLLALFRKRREQQRSLKKTSYSNYDWEHITALPVNPVLGYHQVKSGGKIILTAIK